ncbi:MAG TPA: hypothetical protein DET40_21760 [Lentisphaeria bacterium]|nr:hypothetical protein [Lentisphaeria bacterium]
MDKDTYLQTVEKAKEVVKLDRQLRKSKGLSVNQYQADYMSKKRASARDVGPHKHTAHLPEKQAYQYDLELFLKSVFPEKFYRPFSNDQLRFIKETQELILNGGQYAIGLPRGEGKSTVVLCAVIWSILYGHRRFVVVTCATQSLANRFMQGIKKTLQGERLGSLFPESYHYIKALGGMSQRAAGQTADGKPTFIGWNRNQINMPFVDMDESYLELCKGSIITAFGLTSGIRGLLETLPDGTPLRPDFLFIDDAQTRESAASHQQCIDRETLIKSDLLPMSGIGTEIACLFACTVIEEGDLADKTLSEWQSVRSKALLTFPLEKDGLWREYIEIYRQAQKHGTQKKECNAFYQANRAKMDAGAVVSNPHRLNKGELSALQSIYNFIAKYGEKSFWSELQNEPKQSVSSIYEIKPSLICSRLNHLPRYQIPPEANFLVVMGDVNYVGINYVCCAFKNDFSGYIVDYGKWPEGARDNLIDELQADTTTGAQKIAKGVLDFTRHIYKKPFMKNGKRIFPTRILIDANFMTETVHAAVKALQRSRYPILCDRGRSNRTYKPAKGDKLIGQPGNSYHLAHGNFGDEIVHNADAYRMLAQKSFLLEHGVAGSLTLWGSDPKAHEDFAYEICSERLTKYDAVQNFFEWTRQPNERNDKLDGLVGCYVAGAFCGATITGGERTWRPRKIFRRETRKSKISIED